MPHFYERPYYQAIAHLLTAGDIGARVVSNDAYTGIEVGLEDGSVVIWTNATDTRGWAWSHVGAEGELTAGAVLTTEISASEEEVAKLIAEHPYESTPVTA